MLANNNFLASLVLKGFIMIRKLKLVKKVLYQNVCATRAFLIHVKSAKTGIIYQEDFARHMKIWFIVIIIASLKRILVDFVMIRQFYFLD